MWKLMNEGWFGLVVGVVIAIATTALALRLHSKGLRRVSLRFMSGDVSLVSPSDSIETDHFLEIWYAGKQVPRVTSTSYGIWNDGTETFRHADIVESDPLRLHLTDASSRILQVSVEGQTRTVNRAVARVVSDEDVVLDFDFLDPTDGFRVEVLHTGTPGTLEVAGTIRGLKAGIQHFRPYASIERFTVGVVGAAVLVSVLLLAGVLVTIAAVAIAAPWPKNALYGASFVIFAALMAFAIWPSNQTEPLPRRLKGVPEVISEDARLS
jgi:hypothetical protein